MEQTRELGKFVRWEGVSIDTARRVMTLLPESQMEMIVEIPNEDIPSDEALDIRCASY